MMSKKTHIEKISADNKAIAFDFQYYYFLYRLINLNHDESIGLEVKDDVHIDLCDGTQIIIQLKHSVQTKNDGITINLRTRDKELWKTLSNWSKVISDKNDGRAEINEQNEFINKTVFVLATNKSDNDKNAIIKSIHEYRSDNIVYSDIVKRITAIKNETTDPDLIEYMEDLLSLNQSVMLNFFKKIEFEFDLNDIISKCKLVIKTKLVPENRIDDVFKSLDSQIREDNFFTIKSGGKFYINFNDFYKRYRRHFDLARNHSLPIREYLADLPENIESQIFIKQLMDIEDIQSDDYESMAEFTRFKLKMKNNADYWLKEGELTLKEITKFETDARAKWKNKFREEYRGNVSENDINTKALKILDSTRRNELHLSGQQLDTEMSNGEYYRLSDIPEIGWRKDWEDKYK